MRLVRYFWAFPVTAAGLVLASLAYVSGGSVAFRNGVVEASGGLVASLLRGGRFRQGGAA